MKPLFRFIIIFLISFIFVSCSENNSTQSDYYKYKGTWLWLKTVGGFGGTVTNPQEGTSLKINFDEFSRYRIFRNDSLKVIASYYVEPTDYGNDKISFVNVTTFNYHFSSAPEYVKIKNDTLSSWDGMMDGYISFFKKIN